MEVYRLPLQMGTSVRVELVKVDRDYGRSVRYGCSTAGGDVEMTCLCLERTSPQV